jgi:protein-tyrosine-phosphatase
MKVKAVLASGGALLLGAVITFVVRAEPITEVRAPAPVVFVCRNGVAMSVWSAAYFNRLAAARGLRERAIARASIPSFTEVPFRMAFALALDGFRLDGYRPRVISPDDLRSAELVVAIDTELPAHARSSDSHTEVWRGFPPMREQYFPSREALKARVEALVERLARASSPEGRSSGHSRHPA